MLPLLQEMEAVEDELVSEQKISIMLVEQCIGGLGKLFDCILVHLPNEEVLLVEGLISGAEAMKVVTGSFVDGRFRLIDILRPNFLFKLFQIKGEQSTFLDLSDIELTDPFYLFLEEIVGVQGCCYDNDGLSILAEADVEIKRN